jgi:endonuclease/exonuclease/phosphatase family metal-dependent hydrolase
MIPVLVRTAFSGKFLNYGCHLLIMLVVFLVICSPAAFSQTGGGYENTSGSVSAEADTLRVLSYNIRAGRGTDDVYDFRRIADVIIESRAGLVALQEVDAGVERSGGVDIMQILADYTGMEPFFFMNIPHQGGEYGNGILSRHPVADVVNHHLPRAGDSEQRGLMEAVIDVNGAEILFFNTHLDHRPDDAERLLGVEVILERSGAPEHKGRPVIVAGDLNDIPGSPAYSRIEEYFTDIWDLFGEGDGYTYHTDNPDRRIDYLFFRNAGDQSGADRESDSETDWNHEGEKTDAEAGVDGDHADEESAFVRIKTGMDTDKTLREAGKRQVSGYRLRPVSVRVIESDGSDHLPLLGVFVIERF